MSPGFFAGSALLQWRSELNEYERHWSGALPAMSPSDWDML